MRVVITIPAYNEEKTLPRVLEEILSVMKGSEFKILVLDDGSKDRTADVARKAGAIVFSHTRNKGLAQTFKTEMAQCLKMGADVIVHTDADGQYPAKYIPSLIKKIESGYDLVLGSRFLKSAYSGSMMKNVGNRLFASAISSLVGQKITDSTTGFRAFTREVAEEIEFINTFTYTQEQIIRAARQKFRIAEVPITTRKTRESRLFKGAFQYALKAWINILRIYRDYDPLKFFGKTGLLVFGIGFVLGIYFVYLHLTTGIAGHTALMILMIFLLLLGVQLISFGFIADMWRK